jgi:peptidylprolyl isomerase
MHAEIRRRTISPFARARKAARAAKRFAGTLEALEGRALLAAAIAPIPDVVVPATLGYQVSVDGSASGATAQTLAVTSDNPDIRATVATGQFVTFNVTHTASGAGDVSFSGAITFQLFGDYTPNTAQEIATFVQNGYFTNKQLFRVASGFPNASGYIIQGGSPTNAATAQPSGQPGTPFPDEFNPQLAFTGAYQVAMANSGADTNDTQFFFTTAQPAFLNFGYTIFAQVVAGQNLIQQMTQVTRAGGTTTPVNPITITGATLSSTSPSGVIHIDATHAAPGETATVTVTATDPGTNTTAQRTFSVTAVTDANTPERPFVQTVGPIANNVVTGLNVTIGQGQTASFRIPAVAPTPNDTLTYVVAGGINATTGQFTPVSASNANVTVDQATGVVTLIPAGAFSGTFSLLVGVRDQVNRSGRASVNDPHNFEYHTIRVTVNPTTAPVAQPPIAEPFAQSTTATTPVTVHLQAYNPTPAAALSYALTTPPSHGTVSQFDASAGTFVYTPEAGFVGADRFDYTVTTTGGGLASPLTSLVATGTLNVQSTFTIVGTNPANGSVVDVLPNGGITVTFSHPIAGLTDGGPANLPGNPFRIYLLERGPDGVFSAPSGVDSGDLPLHVNTVYHVNNDGTSSITVTPIGPLASDVYLLHVEVGAFEDTSGYPLADPNNGYVTFLLQKPAMSNVPLQVTGVTSYNGFTTVNNNAIFQPDTLAIHFNRPLYAGAAGGSNVQLLAAPSYTPVPSVATYSPTTNSIYLTPTAALQPGTTYVIAVSGSVSDDQGYGGPGFPLGQPFYDSFQVLNAPAGAGASPLRVAQDPGGQPRTLPADGSLWTAPLGYASVQFTEPLNMSAFGRYSAMLDPRTAGSDNNTALENVPLNAKVAFNPNTNQLIIVPTQATDPDVYVLALSQIQAANGDPLQNSAGQTAGVNGPPVYVTFETQYSTIASAARPAVAAAATVAAPPAPDAVSLTTVSHPAARHRRPAQATEGTPRHTRFRHRA